MDVCLDCYTFIIYPVGIVIIYPAGIFKAYILVRESKLPWQITSPGPLYTVWRCQQTSLL